ncbi:MAG: sulfotransferase [Nanoarchaeota archaeon]
MNNIIKPIFIFGNPKTGTTLLWKALLNHPDVCGPTIEGQDLDNMPKEMKHFFGHVTFMLWAHPDFRMCYWVDENSYNDKISKNLINVYSKYNKSNERFLTKSPADTMRARLLQKIFPDAFFISIVRDPYSNIQSIVSSRKKDDRYPNMPSQFTTIEQASEQWFYANTIILSHKEFLKNYLIIRYEDIIENSDETFKKILSFCQLDYEKFEMPDIDKTKNNIRFSEIDNYDIEVITRICGPLIEHFGYKRLGGKIKW